MLIMKCGYSVIRSGLAPLVFGLMWIVALFRLVSCGNGTLQRDSTRRLCLYS